MSRLLCFVVLLVACSDAERGARDAAEATSDASDGAEISDAADTGTAEPPDGSDASDAGETIAETTPEVSPEVTDADDAADTADTNDTAAADTPADSDGDEVTPDPEWRWEPAPSLPSVVQENAVLGVGDAIWVMGGFENLLLVDRVRVITPEAGQWADGPRLPRALHHLNAAVVGDVVFVLGGLEGFGFSAIANAWRYDTAADSPAWQETRPMPNARRRGSAGVAVVGSEVYLMGGFRGGAVAEVDVFAASRPDAEDAWRSEAALPGARDHGGAASLGGKVYYVGGRETDITAVQGDLWVLDPAAPELGWVALAPLPTPRGGIIVAAYDGLLVVAGGEGNTSVASGVFPDVEAYDPERDRWLVLPAMTTPRHGTGAAVQAGVLWVPGGADVQAFGASAVVERLIRSR
jgi:N-acetylneuraminic acid mutarotase